MKFHIALIFVSVLVGCYARVPEKTGLEGKPIPHFTMLFPDSTTYFNTEHISTNSPTVFVYFGPYCVYSRAQTQEIVDYIDKLKGIKFYFITTAGIREMNEFKKEFKLDKYSNIFVGNDYTHFFADYFEAGGVPFIAIYNNRGLLNAAFQGKVSPKQIKNCAQI